MAAELPLPLSSDFFPPIVLSIDEIMHYRRLSNERVAQLVSIIDDADCFYRWNDIKVRNDRRVQKAQFLDIQPSSKSPIIQHPSTLYKSSFHIVDVQVEEILQAIAKVRTKEARRVSKYLYGDEMADTQTLLTFPTSFNHVKPSYSYRALKWCLLQAKKHEKRLDFCYVEYAGTRKAHPIASNTLVGFCIQESIAMNRKVPTLEQYNILRGQFRRTGIVITQSRQSNILQVTAIAQVDGTMESAAIRETMEILMVDYVASVYRIKGLLEQERMKKLQFLDKWHWVSAKQRKTCSVCLRGFYIFHRKYHCTSCGEVVCSTCAPLRELDEGPLNERTRALRVCSICIAQASSVCGVSHLSRFTESDDERNLDTLTCTTNIGTEIYGKSRRDSKHRGIARQAIEDTCCRSSEQGTPVHLPPLRSRQRCSRRRDCEYSSESDSIDQLKRRTFEFVQREQRANVVKHSTRSTFVFSKATRSDALKELVKQVCQIQDPMNVVISEAEEDEDCHSILRKSHPEEVKRNDESYEQFIKIRETFDLSSVEFNSMLDTSDHNASVSPSSTLSGHFESDVAFHVTEKTDSGRSSISQSDVMPLSLQLSISSQSLGHQDASEYLSPLLPATENALDTKQAMKQGRQQTCQPELAASLHASCMAIEASRGDQRSIDPVALKAASFSALIPTEMCAGTFRRIKRLAPNNNRRYQRSQTSGRVPETMNCRLAQLRRERAEEESQCESRLLVASLLKQPRKVESGFAHVQRNAIAQEVFAASCSPVTKGCCARERCRFKSPWMSPDLVANLRGIMNSSELTPAPLRRQSVTTTAVPTSAKMLFHNTALTSVSSRKLSSRRVKRNLSPHDSTPSKLR